MNDPAAKGMRNHSIFPIFPARRMATISQTIELSAVRKFIISAFFLLNPPWMSTPKSPISCGISWRMTAMVVAIPVGILTR
jgi:hypothetical protein